MWGFHFISSGSLRVLADIFHAPVHSTANSNASLGAIYKCQASFSSVCLTNAADTPYVPQLTGFEIDSTAPLKPTSRRPFPKEPPGPLLLPESPPTRC